MNYGNQLFNDAMLDQTIKTNEREGLILFWCDTHDCLKEGGRIVKKWYPKIGEALTEDYPSSGDQYYRIIPAPPMCRSVNLELTERPWSDHQYCEERGCTDTYTDNNGETFPCWDPNDDPYYCVMGGAHDHFTPGIPQPQRC